MLPLSNKKVLDRSLDPSRTNKRNYPRCHLVLRHCRTLSRIPAYPRQLTYASTSQNTQLSLLTAPSAVHLMTSFPPGSQHLGLSVGSSSSLSPLQRFISILNSGQFISVIHICQEYTGYQKRRCYGKGPHISSLLVLLLALRCLSGLLSFLLNAAIVY